MAKLNNTQVVLQGIIREEFAANDLYKSENHFFEFFATRNILKSLDLSDEEIEHGLIGGANDGGCDAIYIILNGELATEDTLSRLEKHKKYSIELVIVQTKEEWSFHEDVLMKWKTTAGNLLALDFNADAYRQRYNADVLNAFGLFRDLFLKISSSDIDFKISFHYVTLASELHPNVVAQADELKVLLRSYFPNQKNEFSVTFWGDEQLLEAIKTSGDPELKLDLSEMFLSSETHRDFVALVRLNEYYAFITNESKELRKNIFEVNVRDYQGSNAVNQDIKKTLENPTVDEDFWWLNNGITIVAQNVSVITNKRLLLSAPSVVNGLQTSYEIYNYFNHHPEALQSDSRNLLIRIIVPVNAQTRDRVILATNNQTSIPKASLRVNDPLHWEIDTYFRGHKLYYDRRKNYYKNLGHKASEIISLTYLSQCLITLLLGAPDQARARPSTLLLNNRIYSKLYNKKIRYEVYYLAARLGRNIELTLRKSGLYTKAQVNDLLFYVLYYSVASICNKTEFTDADLKDFDLNAVSETYILQTARTVFDEYERLGGDCTVAKGSQLLIDLKEKLNRQFSDAIN